MDMADQIKAIGRQIEAVSGYTRQKVPYVQKGREANGGA